MTISSKDFTDAKQFAKQFGAKAVVYGAPGTGKTPICVTTSPRPLLLLCEPGALTLRGSNVPTFPAFNQAKIADFFDWLATSAEVKNYDTIVVDSISQLAEIVLEKYLGKRSKAGNQADGRKAYGEMAREVMEYLNNMYFMPQKHVVLIAKYGVSEELGVQYSRPTLPGKDLNIRLPHLYDAVLHLGLHLNSGVTDRSTFKCQGDMLSMARDRSGQLAAYEPANMNHIINKIMTPIAAS